LEVGVLLSVNPSTPAPPAFTVACVSDRSWFRSAVADALWQLAGPTSHRTLVSTGVAVMAPESRSAYADVVAQASGYLDARLPAATIRLACASTAEEVPREVSRLGGVGIAVLVVDAGSWPLPADAIGDDPILSTIERWPAALRPEISPYGIYVYQPFLKPQVQPVARYTLRQLPDEPWVVSADLICAFADYVEVRHVRTLAADRLDDAPTTLATLLHRFLTARAGSDWTLWTYTGSVVSGVIADLERLARQTGNPVLRGPSEHSLACGAMARWLLDRAPFLIVVTSAMVDEFRGTLANLRQAGARGFIICADSAEDRWYPFQGTVHAAEDSRAVLSARRIRHGYLARADQLDRDLQEAFAAYDEDDGPVVLLVAPSVLDTRVPATGVPAAPRPPVARVGPEDALDAVIRIVNTESVNLLWQVGALPPEHADLLYDISARAGAALVDSLARPGTVCGYRDGAKVPNYLGTMGLYGFSASVFDFLHRGGRLRPRTEQCLFFLASRIGEVSTPFSARMLEQSLRIVQLTANDSHLAPFADVRLHGDLGAFLHRLGERLAVDDDVLRRRRAAIAAVGTSSDPLRLVPVRPMTSNYFFGQLNEVVEELIRTQGYRYTGVYDVGRGGAAAIRNVARTDAGFSGWYGRALMGDALQAIPTIALTRPGNVLAFIGDGAAALVPNILPSLLQQICLDGHRLAGNLSIFWLLNGGHSIIRTYRETRGREPEGGQTTVFNILDDDWSRVIGPVRVTHRLLDGVDRHALAAELTTPGVINLYSVLLSHNNEGDGLSLLSARGWHHSPPRRGRNGGAPVEGEEPQ